MYSEHLVAPNQILNIDMAKPIPDSLEKLLNVVPRTEGGKGVTSAVEPSKLLGKLNAFLPQLKAANSQIGAHQLNSIPAPKLVSKSSGDAKDGDADGYDEMDEGMTVNMDVYVDESQGELVAKNNINSAAIPKDGAKPLIEVVEEPAKNKNTTT